MTNTPPYRIQSHQVAKPSFLLDLADDGNIHVIQKYLNREFLDFSV